MDTHQKILIAVDSSEHSRRVLDYVGRIMDGRYVTEVTILQILPQVLPDIFENKEARAKHEEKLHHEAGETMSRSRGTLLEAGFKEESIKTVILVKDCPSVAQCILEEQRRGNFTTLVVGRRRLIAAEEFLFGSVSSAIVQNAKDCAIWVIG